MNETFRTALARLVHTAVVTVWVHPGNRPQGVEHRKCKVCGALWLVGYTAHSSVYDPAIQAKLECPVALAERLLHERDLAPGPLAQPKKTCHKCRAQVAYEHQGNCPHCGADSIEIYM